MKRHEACDEASIRARLDYLNVCHDGSVRRISFLKCREYTEEGNLVYPDVDPKHLLKDLTRCDIELELLLNSYEGASPKQVVVLNFEEVRSFRFFQENTFDYPEIYEVTFRKSGEGEFEFVFRVRPAAEKIDALSIICPKIVCTELDEQEKNG